MPRIVDGRPCNEFSVLVRSIFWVCLVDRQHELTFPLRSWQGRFKIRLLPILDSRLEHTVSGDVIRYVVAGRSSSILIPSLTGCVDTTLHGRSGRGRRETVSPLIAPWCTLIAEEVEGKILNSRLGETQFAERARNEGGALHCVNIIQFTEYLIPRSRKRRNSSESEGSVQSSPLGYESFAPQHNWDLDGGRREIGGLGQGVDQRADGRVCFPRQIRVPLRSPRSTKQGLPSTQEDPRARFFEDYCNEAEEYDREFMKKYDEDLNTTLIFVSSVWCSGVRVLTRSQAGLFSAVTSAFIIEVHSHLQQDPNDETAALLRVLIYKIDNTTFGNNPPTIPQWTGPPQTIVHVQAILLASLAASLLSAFLAMLGKQWLN